MEARKWLIIYIITLVVLSLSILFGQGRFKFGFITENQLKAKALALSDENAVVVKHFNHDEFFNDFSVVVIKQGDKNYNIFNFTKNFFFPLYSLEQQYKNMDLENERLAYSVTTTTRSMAYEVNLNETTDDASITVYEHQPHNTDHTWIVWNLLMLFASITGIIRYIFQSKFGNNPTSRTKQTGKEVF